MSTILNNHVFPTVMYTKHETFISKNDIVVTGLASVSNRVELDYSGAPHNLVPLMEVAKINFKNRFVKMSTQM